MEKTIAVPMTLTRLDFVCKLIDFAWQNGNIRDPQTASYVQDLKAFMRENIKLLAEETIKNVEKPK
jgi:hypothetical protein